MQLVYFTYLRKISLAMALLACLGQVSATTLQYGDDIESSIETEGEEDTYTFEGAAGDRVFIRMRDAESAMDACIFLYDPVGNLLGQHCRDGGIVALHDVKLSSNGTYTIIAKDNNDNDVGNYGLSLDKLNGTEDATPLVCGDDFTTNLKKVTQTHSYSFTATAGEIALIRLRAASIKFESELALYDPSGNLLATNYTSVLTKIGPFTLPETGTYQVLVMDHNGNDTGAYGFSYQIIGRDGCSQELRCGEENGLFNGGAFINNDILDFSISNLGEVDAYHFYAEPGEVVLVQMYSPKKGFEVSMRLFDGNGNLLKFPPTRHGGVRLAYDSFTEAGDYYLIVCDNNGNDLSEYGLFMERVTNGGCGSALNCTSQQDGGELKQYGAMKSYTFTSTAGSAANFLLEPLEQIGLDPRLELYAPDGSTVFDEFSYGSVDLKNVILPADGAYTVVVSDYRGNDLGDYNLFIDSENTVDGQAPVIHCKSPEDVYYLQNGTLTIDVNSMVEEAYDQCSAVTVSPDVFTFTCENVGENWVTIEATDESGNVGTCEVRINIEEVEGLCQADYCTSKGLSTDYEWINKVAIANMGYKTSNGGGYEDLTDHNIKLYRNGTYGIYLTPGFSNNSGSQSRFWRTWIDWNRDGDFDDEGELILQDKTKYTVKSTFIVPVGASRSGIRMRISMKYGSYPSACETFEYGEVEDYLITVIDEPVCDDIPENWYQANIGQVPVPGSVCYEATDNTFNVSGSGKDIYGTKDEFYFVYTELCGNGDIIAKVHSQDGPSNYSLSGVMFRKNLKESSENVGLFAIEKGGIVYQAREKFKGHTIYQEHEGDVPHWVKLERRNGNQINGYVSTDGEDWQLVCPFEMDFPECIKVGLAVSGNNSAKTEGNASVFKHVKVIPFVDSGIASSNEITDATHRGEDETNIAIGQNANPSFPSRVEVFPNPANDFTWVDCADCVGQNTMLQLFSINGAMVWEKEFDSPAAAKLYCDFSALEVPNGQYLLSIQAGEWATAKKINLLR